MDNASGLLNLDKPAGVTSRDVVDVVARLLPKVKVGHAGTLDPLATGVLVLCVGPATRLIEYVQRMPKTYRAVVRLGATSNTLDADGTVVETTGCPVPSKIELADALAAQVGTIDQVPPRFSAIKVAGKRSYDLARAGRSVELEARPVTIARIEILAYNWPMAELEIDCGSGTYIRSIARDVGEALGTGALIAGLTRTRIGRFTREDALDPATLGRDNVLGLLRSPLEAVDALPRVVLDEAEAVAIVQGRPVGSKGAPLAGEMAALGPSGLLVAIVEPSADGRWLAPKRVFGAGPAPG